MDYAVAVFKKGDCVGVSLSIDGTQCISAILKDQRHMALVEGAHPNHLILISVDGTRSDENEELVAKFIEDKIKNYKNFPDYVLADEVKLATLAFQWVSSNQPVYLQIAIRPQTKNDNGDFNNKLCKLINNACVKLNHMGYKISFLNQANDGVSSDKKFVRKTLIMF